MPGAPAEAVYILLYLRYCKGSRLTPLSGLQKGLESRQPLLKEFTADYTCAVK
jgi:hypothetical protein